MGRGQRLSVLLFTVLVLAASLLAARVARHHEAGGRLRLELGRERVTRLDPAARARFASLPEPLRLTFYVSAREHMPSELRRVERSVTALLETLRRVSRGRVDFHVFDPSRDPELAAFAARRRVAPFRARSVSRDAWSERTVWSALALAYGSRPEVTIDGVVPELVPRLPALILEHLERLERPQPPVLALAAPAATSAPGGNGFEELAAALAERGTLQRVDLDAGAPWPAEADVLFWIEPQAPSAARLQELERFLASGRSVVLAASALHVRSADLVLGEEGPVLRLSAPDLPAEALMTALGLQPQRGLLLDEQAERTVLDATEHVAPFLVRCSAPNQDFAGWRLQPNGNLLFTTPTPLHPQPEALAERGWSARVLATSSDASRSLAHGADAVEHSLASLATAGEAAAKAPLAVHLAPSSPARGHVVALAAATPFEDGLLHRPGTAHLRLLDALLAELASNERLVLARAEPPRPEPLADLTPAARLGWRLCCVLAGPALILFASWGRARDAGGAAAWPRWRDRSWRRWRAAGVPLALAAAALGLARAFRGAEPRLDLTADERNGLAPETRELAARACGAAALRAELLVSPRARFPEMRPGLDRLRWTLGELVSAGAELELVERDPEELDPDDRAAYAAEGVRAQRLARRDGDVTTVRTLWASLLIAGPHGRERLDFADALSFESLEFRLAFALWRLQTGERARVAFASDVPRPSAAEAHELYQQQGLFAPQGTDPYAEARKRLAELGFDVLHVNPRDPQLPEDLDLLVWLQPRRPIEPMLARALRYLHGGGSVLLAAQHFNVQARQHRGAGFATVYWPQPQLPDVDRRYFPELSIELVREVLFDELATAVDDPTYITGRDGARDLQRQTSALPFLVRASAANHARGSTVTAGLGDQAFLWASPLRFDAARLRELGLSAEVLLSTSPRAWTYAWSGGWIPPEALAGPPAEPTVDAAAAPRFSGPWPLAVLFEGTFPRPLAALADEDAPAVEEELPWPAPAPGRLLFLGASEPFKDGRLLDPRFRGDHLLANAAATLALPAELARVAARRAVAPGFGWVAPERRLAWRAFVVGAGPAALLVLALGLRGRGVRRGLREARP